MKLVIDRNKWLRGEGGAVSALRRKSDSKMCCLGFFAKELGYEDDMINDRSSPEDFLTARVTPNYWPKWAVNEEYEDGEDPYRTDTCDLMDLMKINDDEHMSDEEREGEIKRLFAEHGVDVEFVE